MSTEDTLQVAIDLDDVTVDFFQGVIDSMYREFDVLILKEDVVTWDDNPVKLFDWKSWGYKSWWDWMRQRDWLWATFPAVPGAIGGIHRIRAAGHYVECVTSKPSWAEPMVQKWLGKWRPDFNRVTIVDLDHPKHEVSPADILVDDKPDNILGWVASADDRLGILYDQPWNRDMEMGERMVRARSWQEVVESIDLFEEV